jgi:hypothetical protein
MNFGFNSNVRVGDAVYHVQTEDRGPAHPFIDTIVYLSGRVVHKRSTSYEKYVRAMSSEKALAQWLRDRVSQQHREVIADLEAGKLQASGKEKPAPSAPGQSGAKALLELKLKNPQSWFVAGKIVLEIELMDPNAKSAVGDAEVQAYLENGAHRTPCAEARTDASGGAKLHFPMPAEVSEGSFLVVRAADGQRHAELRFRMRAKPRENTQAPVGR